MKNNYLSIGLVMVLLFTASAIKAQDLGITQITLPNFTEVKSGTTRDIGLGITVFGNVPIANTFSVKYRIDGGTEATAVSGLSSGGTPVGQEIAPFYCPVSFPAANNDTIELSVYLDLPSDTNTSNDTVRATFVVKDVIRNDLKVIINKPTPGQKVEVNKPFQMEVFIKNTGSNALPKGSYLLERFTANGLDQRDPGISIYEGAALQPGDSFLYRVIDIDLSSADVGSTIEFCNTVLWTEIDTRVHIVEGYPADNDGCVTILGVPNSLDEGMDKPLIKSLNLLQDQLEVSFNPEVLQDQQVFIEAYSISGQLLATQNAHSNTVMMPLPTYSGMLLVKVTTSSGGVTTAKLMK